MTDRNDSERASRPDGWRCLCEGDHDEGCPWGPYLVAPTQRQDSLNAQMLDLIRIAEREGMYDAADWIKARWNMPRYSRMSEAAMKAALPNPDDLA